MAEHRITDFVDQKAIDRLKELSAEMQAVKEMYKTVAQELLKGLDCPVKTLEDLQKLMEMYNKSERVAIETTEKMNRVVAEQREIVQNTTNTISRALQEQEKQNKTMREAYTEHGKVKALLEQVNGTYESNLKLMQDYQQKINNCKARLAELAKEYKEGKISQEEYDRQQLQVTKNMRLLTEEKRQLTVLIKNEEREMTTVQGSYNHLSQQLELLKKAYKEMNEEGKASELGKDMEAAIQGLDAHLKDLAADMGEYQRNVGNYAIAGAGVKKELSELMADITDLTMAYRNLSDAEKQSAKGQDMKKYIDTMTERAKVLKKTIDDTNASIKDTGDETPSIKKDMKELVLEIANLTIAYQNMSAEEQASAQGQEMKQHINELTERAGVLKDAIDDTNQAIKNAASDSRAFDQISAGIKLLIDGFGLATGAAQMLGLSEEDLIEVQTKLQAAIVASNAVKEIQIALQKQSALMQGIYTIQTKAATAAEWAKTAAVGKGVIATKAATVAQKAFNLVAKANPYVLLAMAVVTVVGALLSFAAGSKKAKEEEEKHQAQLDKLKESQERFKNKVVESAGAQVAAYLQMKAQWKSLRTEMEKNKFIDDTRDKWKKLGKEIGNVNDAEKIFENQTDIMLKSILDRAMIDAYKDKISEVAAKYVETLVSPQGFETTKEDLKHLKFGYYRFEGKTKNGGGFGDESTITQHEIDQLGEGDIRWMPEVKYGEDRRILTEQGRQKINQMRDDEALRRANEEIERYNKEIVKYQESLNESMKILAGKTIDPDSGSNLSVKAKSEKELADQMLKIRQDSIKAQLALEKEGTEEWYQLKLQSIRLEEQAEIASADKTRDQTLADLKESLKRKKITQEQYDQMSAEAIQENENRVQAIIDQSLQNQKDAYRATVDYKIEKTQEEFAARQAIADQAYNDELKNLQRAHAANLEDIQQRQTEELTAAGNNALRKAEIIAKYDAQRAEETIRHENEVATATEQYAQETAQRQIDAIEAVLAMEDLSAEERKKLKAELDKANTDLANATADAEIAAIQRTQKAEEEAAKASEEAFKKRMERAQQWLQMASQGLNAIAGLANAIYDAKIQELEDEQEAEDEKYEAETERNQEAADAEQELISDLVEKKVITEEEGEARKRAAAANSAAKQKKLDDEKAKRDKENAKKQAELKHKQAVWDKANNIIQAVMSTSLAVMNAWATAPWPVNIAMAATAGAIGAIQIATIAAQPIPKYAKGTKDHPGGPAIVGDAGKHEVIELNGELLMTPDKPTMIDLPKGAAVYPDIDEFIERSLTVLPTLDTSGGREIVQVNFDMKGFERQLERNTDILKSIEYGQKQLTKVLHDAAYEAEYERYKESRI